MTRRIRHDGTRCESEDIRPHGYGPRWAALNAGMAQNFQDEVEDRPSRSLLDYGSFLRTPGDYCGSQCRVLMADGVWLVPENERPSAK